MATRAAVREHASGEHASGPRHSTGNGVSRRGLIGIVGAGAVASACGTTAAVAPDTVQAALDPVVGALGGDRGEAAVARSLKRASQQKQKAGGAASGAAASGAGSSMTPKPSMKPAVRNGSFGAAGGRPPAPSTNSGLTQPATPLSTDQALHVARRAAWGATPALLTQIRKGSTAWIDRQLNWKSIPDGYVEGLVGTLDTIGAEPATLLSWNGQREKQDYFYAHSQLEVAAIWRASYSERQLYEVMVDFWHNRLHVPSVFDKSRNTLNQYDVLVIRPYALGKFSDMLWAMLSKSSAMLVYLDNHLNTKNGGNQNLGRELLELHTLGVDAGYTQSDVIAASKLLTGLGIDDAPPNGQSRMVVTYHPDRHHVGPVKVFGKTYANGSADAGMVTIKQLSDDLARHPKTAYSLALDLCRRFVSDQPPVALIKRLATTYLKNDTDIAPVVKQLLTSREFKASVGQKYRRPLESLVATIRTLDVKPTDDAAKRYEVFQHLRWSLYEMDQRPYGHNAPDGHADYARRWLSTVGVLNRWNMYAVLAGGWHKDGLNPPDVTAMLGNAATYGDAVDALWLRLLYEKATSAERAAILTFLEEGSADPLTADQRANNYNLRARATALILGSVDHQMR
ncbi:MAG: DUF1800 domain-containing protein [Angustibacter sp.]